MENEQLTNDPVHVSAPETTPRTSRGRKKKDREKTPKMLSNEELSSFFSQLGMIIGSGIAPVDGLDLMLTDKTNGAGAALLTEIRDKIAGSSALSEAAASTGVFPDYALKVLSVGEASGQLDTVCNLLADYYQRASDNRTAIRSAVSYPIIMILLMAVIVIILLTRVMPIFEKVFAQFGTTLTGVAAICAAAGKRLSAASAVITVIFAVLAVIFFWFYGTESGRKRFWKLLETFPASRTYSEEIATQHFAESLSLTLRSGLDAYTSLSLAASTMENEHAQAKVARMIEDLKTGQSFQEALTASGIFSNVYARMAGIGAMSGNTEDVLDKIAGSYRRSAENRLDRMLAVIEPTLVIILSIVVGLILLSAIIPLMGIMANLG